MWRGKDSAVREGKFFYDIVMTARNKIFFFTVSTFILCFVQLICVQFSQCQLSSVLFNVPTLGLNHCLKTLPGTAAHSADVIQLGAATEVAGT